MTGSGPDIAAAGRDPAAGRDGGGAAAPLADPPVDGGAAAAGRPLLVLLLGGSRSHTGGLESFCDQSKLALERHGAVVVERIRTDTAFLSARRLPRVVRGLGTLAAWRGRRPDCIWLQYANLPDLGFLAVARLAGMRVMVTPHLGTSWRSQASPMLRHLGGWTLRMASRLALLSPTQDAELELPRPIPRSLIRNFLPQEILTAPLPDGTRQPAALQLIHSGRLSEAKGSFLFVEVCVALRDAGVPFVARITGGADEATLARLHRLIADKALGDSVHVLGRVAASTLVELLLGADVLVHLSREDSYPLIVLEAMACACVPLCLELSGARDMVDRYGGHIVGPEDPVGDAGAWLMSQPPADIRRTGRRLAELVRRDYAWPRCAAALEAALRACATGSQAPTRPPALP